MSALTSTLDRPDLPIAFRRVWLAQTTSEVGSMLTAIAAAVYVVLETGSAVWLGLLTAATAAPSLLVAALAPAIDRHGPRRAMLVADAVAATAPVSLLVLVAAGALEPWHLVLGGAISGFGTAVQHAAGQAALPALVGPEQLARANGLRQVGPALGIVLGPALATPILVHAGVATIFVVDLMSFVVGFVVVARTRFGPTDADTDDDGTWRSAWRWLRTEQPVLLALMGATAVVNLAFAVFNVALLANTTLVVGATSFGLVLALGGLAMLAGAAAAGWFGARPDRVGTLSIGLMAASLGCVIGGVRPSGPLIVLGVVVALGLVPIVNATMSTIYSERVPERLQGRVFALRGAVSQVLQPLGSLAGGVVIAVVAQPALASDRPGAGLLRLAAGGEVDRGAGLTLVAVGIVLAALGGGLRRSRLRRALHA